MEWWVWVALGLDIALVLVLYLIYGRGGDAPVAVHALAAHSAAPAAAPLHAPAPATEPESHPAPAPSNTDDLALIEGIGPRINEVLQTAGIRTFADLAAAPMDRIQQVLDAAGLSLADPGTWGQQAALAAEGRLDALKELQDSLKAGRAAAG